MCSVRRPGGSCSGTKASEIFYFEDVVVDGDAWGAADALMQDFGLLEADGQTKLPASACEVADESLQCFHRVRCQSSVICDSVISVINIWCTLVLARSRARLKRFPSVLVWR